MEKDFIITSVFTPFTISVMVVVAGTLFLIIYDMIRWWRERRRKPIDPPARPIPYKKYVHTLREHKEVCEVSGYPYSTCTGYMCILGNKFLET